MKSFEDKLTEALESQNMDHKGAVLRLKKLADKYSQIDRKTIENIIITTARISFSFGKYKTNTVDDKKS